MGLTVFKLNAFFDTYLILYLLPFNTSFTVFNTLFNTSFTLCLLRFNMIYYIYYYCLLHFPFLQFTSFYYTIISIRNLGTFITIDSIYYTMVFFIYYSYSIYCIYYPGPGQLGDMFSQLSGPTLPLMLNVWRGNFDIYSLKLTKLH